MSKAIFGLVAVGLAAPLLFPVGTARADPYKWCAVYSGLGGKNCGFVTIEQCQATVSGAGGTCEPNQFYTGPDRGPRQLPR